ncbi:MAG: hypothetical protein IJC66_04525 [Kiritimatiellae bacterium]|nr:hypothetical protein [Kiritimatiellia bacterium]
MHLKKLCFVSGNLVFVLSASVVSGIFAAPSTYDDMAALRPPEGVSDFWNTTGHSGVAIDVADSPSVGIDSRVPRPASAGVTLGSFDSRWCTDEESPVGNLYTGTPGTIILFR